MSDENENTGVASTLNVTTGSQPTITVTAKWIVQNHNGMPDHACAECAPYSEIIIDGFQCNYHMAKSALANSQDDS